MFLYSITPQHKKYCFRSFAFTHILVILFALPSSLIISNIFNGLYWFVMPVLIVICNENTAYYVGRVFGRTQISEISPKKTLEGFLVGLIVTVLFSFLVRYIIIINISFKF